MSSGQAPCEPRVGDIVVRLDIPVKPLANVNASPEPVFDQAPSKGKSITAATIAISAQTKRSWLKNQFGATGVHTVLNECVMD